MTGIVVLYKPEEITSFLAVAKTRRICGEKKAGHAGTLDPMATGVLPILFGGATRFLEFVPTSPKRYTAVLRLGLTTDTLDITGEVQSETPVTVGREALENALPQFRGDIMQVPPMYSAIKKDGVRMYDLARQGIEVEREARPVTIYELNLLSEEETAGKSLQEHEYVLDVLCSSGTYIRTLIDDLGRVLGCGAVMTDLTRTAVGPFSLENAVTLEQLETAAEEGTLEQWILPVEDALKDYPISRITEAQAKRFCNGGELFLDRLPSLKKKLASGALEQGSYYRMFGPENTFVGLGEVDLEQNLMRVKRVFIGR